MQFSKEKKGKITVVNISGKIIGAPDVASINNIFSELIQDDEIDVVVDLAAVEMINSSGLGSLIANMTSIKKKGGNLKFASVSDQVLHVLKITRLDTVFDIYNSLDEAIKSF